MWRYLAGGASALVMVGAGFFLVRIMATPDAPIGQTETRVEQSSDVEDKLAAPMTFAERIAPAPKASEKTKEEKRFNRFDKDKNGGVSRDEYLQSRRKAYAKLDVNGDGKLSFEEYATKTIVKFVKADGDRTGALNRSEFSTTRVIRKSKPKPYCPPSRGPIQAPADSRTEDDA
jgi:Ca2+-binding EF-hand superfamily protein